MVSHIDKDQEIPPWEQNQRSQTMPVLTMLGMLLLGGILCVAVLAAGMLLMTTIPPGASDGHVQGLLGGLMLFCILLVCVGGVMMLQSSYTDARQFTPKYDPVPPHHLGAPLAVRFRRNPLWRSLAGKGTIQFDQGHLSIDGSLIPHVLRRIGSAALTTFMLLAFNMRTPKMQPVQQAIPYTAMHDVRVRGAEVSFTYPGNVPETFTFRVSVQDGERLYRELDLRFPGAVHLQG